MVAWAGIEKLLMGISDGRKLNLTPILISTLTVILIEQFANLI